MKRMDSLFLDDSSCSAVFSADRKHRFELWRRWGEAGAFAAFIGLNPSTADENQDDPTVRRCINYARAWGYDAMCMLNIFSLRATDPKVMLADDLPNLMQNDEALILVSRKAGLVVAAWGAQGEYRHRGWRIARRLTSEGVALYCLGETKTGHPRHPLYMRKDIQPIPYNDLSNTGYEAHA